MARYVLLVIEDNAEADAFVKAVQDNKVIFAHTYTNDGVQYAGVQGVSVRAVWMKPTKFCECVKPTSVSVRGEKYGLFVHFDCRKPKRGSWQHPRNLLNNIPAAAQAEHLGSQEPPALPGQRDIYLGVLEPRPADGVTTAPVGAPYRNKS